MKILQALKAAKQAIQQRIEAAKIVLTLVILDIFTASPHRRGVANLKGFIIFGVIIYLSFWLGSMVLQVTNLNSIGGIAGVALASIVPLGIGYYAYNKYGKSLE